MGAFFHTVWEEFGKPHFQKQFKSLAYEDVRNNANTASSWLDQETLPQLFLPSVMTLGIVCICSQQPEEPQLLTTAEISEPALLERLRL